MRLQRALADAVLALRDPYRLAVIERYLEGADYGSIAERHGISEEAARKRVSRGLDLLRRRLERELGGEAQGLCLALLGVRLEPGEALRPGTLAGIAMGTKLVAWGALLGLAAVSFFLWHESGREAAGALAPDEPASDDLGRFRFTDLAPGEYRIDASRHRMGAVTVTQEFDGALSALARVARGGRVEEIELVLDLSRSIAGRLVDEQGVPVASMLVWLSPRNPGAGPELNQVTGVDGRFEFRGLRRGAYDLDAYATGIGAAEGAPPFLNVARDGVPSGTTELEIVLERVPLTTGVVRNADGTPAVKASVFAFDAAGRRVDLSYTDAEGRFALTLEPGTIAELFVRPAPLDGPYWDHAAIARIPQERAARVRDVGAGDEGLEIDLPEPDRSAER